MPTPQEYMELRAPVLYADSGKDNFIAQAELETGGSYCDTAHRNKAVFLLAAHWMTLKSRDGNGTGSGIPGTIKGEKEGDLSRTYENAGGADSNMDPFLGQTSWGVELYNLQRGCFMFPRTRQI